MCFTYITLGLYVLFSVRQGPAFREMVKYLPDGGRWVSDAYVDSLRDHTVSPVNPNESLHSSLRDRLVRFKRATKAVNGLDMVKHSLTLVLW